MRGLILLLVVGLLGGCATGMGVTAMSPEQLAEFAKIKDSTITCVKGVYAGVTVTATFLNVDSTKVMPNGVTVKDSCEITFSKSPAP